MGDVPATNKFENMEKKVVQEEEQQQPKKMIEINGMRIQPQILDMEKYRPVQSLRPGMLIWGILAKYPYWPCMVCTDPSGLYLRQAVGKHILLQMHVRFFGPKGLRSWINPTNHIIFDPNEITDALRNGHMGRRIASDKILAELNWAIEDACIVAAEDDLANRAVLFQNIIDEQFSRWKEDRKVSKEASVKRRRSSIVSLDGGDRKRMKMSAGLSDTDISSHSFRSVSSSSGVSTMSKLSTDALSVSSSGLGELDDDEVHVKSSKPANNSPNDLEEQVATILKAIPFDLAEIKKNAQATLCRNCTRDSTFGSLVQCMGVCGGMYHEHCLALMGISFDRLVVSDKFKSGLGRGKKKGKKSSSHLQMVEQSNGLDHVTTTADHACQDSIIAHVTGDMTIMAKPTKAFKCKACLTGELPDCFICHEPTNGRRNSVAERDADQDVTYCSVAHCGRAYHLECLNQWPQAKKRQQGFICPQHQCHLCISDNPRSQNFKMKQKLFRCLLCPTAYHLKENCMPAGTEIVGAEAIICQRHFTLVDGEPYGISKRTKQKEEEDLSAVNTSKDAKNNKRKPLHIALNVNWCFICARGGNLVCCDQCPSAFHRECLKLAPVNNDTEEANTGKFICEECELGRFPLYGELVWAKFSNYRWWPGVIVSDGQVPARLNTNRRSRGEFCIKFLGSNDYGWISRRRVFLYHDDDALLSLDVKGHKLKTASPVKGKGDANDFDKADMGQRVYKAVESGNGVRSGSYESSFRRSLFEARIVNDMLQKRKQLRDKELSKLLRPVPYLKLKVNRAVAPIKLHDYRSEDLEGSICNCSVTEDEPLACGPNSECLNRLLLTECNPVRCPAGKLCDNQQLQRRQYPPLDIIRTVGKGWGLISKNDLRAGDLVCEYVGELINNAEMRRRIKEKEAEKDDVYYFLTLTNNLIIDAERKGNLARFMNHSCEPNCESQKWTVNGNTRVGLFAKTDIKANIELTFNYNWESTGTNRTACQCGARKCKGFIGTGMKKT